MQVGLAGAGAEGPGVPEIGQQALADLLCLEEDRNAPRLPERHFPGIAQHRDGLERLLGKVVPLAGQEHAAHLEQPQPFHLPSQVGLGGSQERRHQGRAEHGVGRLDRVEQLDGALTAAFEHEGPAVVDCRVTREENVFPMVAPGGSIDEMLGGIPGGPVSEMLDDELLEEVWE